MAGQAKPGIFGCSSSHKIIQRTGSVLSPEQFLALEEVKQHIAANPDAISVTETGVFMSDELSMRYLQLSGNKKAKKAFRKARAGKL